MDKITVVLFSTVAMLVMPNIKTSSMYSIPGHWAVVRVDFRLL